VVLERCGRTLPVSKTSSGIGETGECGGGCSRWRAGRCRHLGRSVFADMMQRRRNARNFAFDLLWLNEIIHVLLDFCRKVKNAGGKFVESVIRPMTFYGAVQSHRRIRNV
jgi:hypothetical protein